MKTKLIKRPANAPVLTAALGLILLMASACANRGSGPQGGPKDTIPPMLVSENPISGTVNWQKKSIEVVFDENITIENVAQNVLVSPPQKKMPDIQAINKKLTIKFAKEDTLLANTTYTIDFGNAIQDNNEKNALEGYRFSFSTGPEIDTLQIGGILIDAETLNPMPATLIGVYDADTYTDTTFSTTPFRRIGRSGSDGRFIIDNLSAGAYRVMALADGNRNYHLDPGEGIAFLDSVISPTCDTRTTADTTWTDSVSIDTIRISTQTTYQPQDVLLRFFKDNKKRQYLASTERKEQNRFTITFGAPADTTPSLRPLNFENAGSLRLQDNSTHDTLTYWIIDSLICQQDTLQMELTYMKTDSVFELYQQTDTIRAIYRRPRTTPRTSGKTKSTRPEPMKLKTNIQGDFDINKPLLITTETPVDTLRSELIRLIRWKDSVSTQLPVSLTQADSSHMRYSIDYAWEPEAHYELQIDSGAMVDVYGKSADKQSNKFKVKSLDQYSKLIVILSPFEPQAVIQVLNAKDEPIRTLPAAQAGTVFDYLAPGEYFMRLFIDADQNGKWTTGNAEKGILPEEVFYFPDKLTLRANWDTEETWDCKATPLLEQKPAELMPSTSSSGNKQSNKGKGRF